MRYYTANTIQENDVVEDDDLFDPFTMTDDEYIEYRRERRKIAYYDDPSNFEDDSFGY